MIILDTNVVSEVLRPKPSPSVHRWLSEQDDLGLTNVTIGELAYGIERLPAGRRRQLLDDELQSLVANFGAAIAPYDTAAAIAFGRLQAVRRAAGRPTSTEDAMIGAICLTGGHVLATRNTKDFEGMGVHLVNPWDTTDDESR